jgi:thiosulfate dehydrogenase [quinone] large subunit
VPEPNVARLLFADIRLAPVWFVVRVYLGYLWLVAGWEKLVDPSGVWVGSKAGAAVAGFAQGAMQQTAGDHPQVTGWYAGFLKSVVVPNAADFSYLVTFGESLVGLALILGLFTGIAAFFGGFMNASYIFAGVGLAGRRLLGPRPVGSPPPRRPRLAGNHVPRKSYRRLLYDVREIRHDGRSRGKVG